MAMSDVIVIGAGPFGLSISSHLRHRGVEHTVVGRPMNTWRNHMPLGLFLKSEPYGSVISAATQGYNLENYSRLHGFNDYVARVGPLSLERFLGYADWFTEKLIPGTASGGHQRNCVRAGAARSTIRQPHSGCCPSPFGSARCLALHLDGIGQSTMDVDHVIAGTGFRVDVSRLPFLSAEIKSSLVTGADCPLVNRAGESSVSGLYFAGAHTMVSLGSGVRFTSGTHYTAARLARSVARRAGRGARTVEPELIAAAAS